MGNSIAISKFIILNIHFWTRLSKKRLFLVKEKSNGHVSSLDT